MKICFVLIVFFRSMWCIVAVTALAWFQPGLVKADAGNLVILIPWLYVMSLKNREWKKVNSELNILLELYASGHYTVIIKPHNPR